MYSRGQAGSHQRRLIPYVFGRSLIAMNLSLQPPLRPAIRSRVLMYITDSTNI